MGKGFELLTVTGLATLGCDRLKIFSRTSMLAMALTAFGRSSRDASGHRPRGFALQRD
jgi:hypothetical protein